MNPSLLFVFGTLKRGFPLHRAIRDAPYLGPYRTVERYPMFVAGPRYAPMMLNEPGVGRLVNGEVYRTRNLGLAALDEVESVGKPGNFRAVVEVIPLGGGASIAAWAYFKSRELAVPAHTELLDHYQDRRFTGLPKRHRQSFG